MDHLFNHFYSHYSQQGASKGEGSIISDEGGRWDLLKKIYHDGEYINCAFLTLLHRGCHYKKIWQMKGTY